MANPSDQQPSGVLSLFHPAVGGWFASRFAQPTPAQERGWPAIRSGRDTLIAAPTGSGKTLAAFLNAIDLLVMQALSGALPGETQVLYVSPLKALSNDVQKNLSEPLAQVRDRLMTMGLPAPDIRVLVRTGDTPSRERQAMTRHPPHILVTTPESLYILLTSGGGRAMLKSVRTVIVDEIHAVARDKRGSHLALSLERLDALTKRRSVRIGLSATQRPIEEVARFLVGARHVGPDGSPDCTIIDEGHVRTLDLALELPGAPLSAVMANETWEEIYDRLAELIGQNRTTLVFTNTRRLAERASMNLAKRLGEGQVTSHHGSLSREQRLQAEQRLKAGDLRALVATASLELGIDIGAVDLVCQLGSTRSIATFLQRVGRSAHTPATGSGPPAVPRGRIFPLTRDDLVECAALLWSARRGMLDRLSIPEKALDILAQQIVAAVAVEEWREDGLFELARGAYPYRNLAREEFDRVVQMLAEGFSSRRGRTGAHIHYDGVGGRLRGRRGARLAAITSGGAIPETADYQVVLEPQGTPVGTVNEDFAIESMAGDIFQLGISSWRILKVEQGKVRVEDAHGLPPTIPFWLGEAPARTLELSAQVSALRAEVESRLDCTDHQPPSPVEGEGAGGGDPPPLASGAGFKPAPTVGERAGESGPSLPQHREAVRWLADHAGIASASAGPAEQIVEYLAATKAALGVVPTQETLVLERFFDETGGMQLVLHAPFGGRVNRAWGLALRKRFCRTFNQELQAAATEDSVVLSLGPQHSFPLEDVWSYLRPATAQDVLVQALLAAPMFTTRWRWNLTRALAVLRQERGRKVPMPIQRMRSDDLLASVFPAQVACAENAPGDIEVPGHPLVAQTVDDCLHEAMDVEGLVAVLTNVEQGRVRLVSKDTVEPSPMAAEILNAKPYAFLDDAPLEERRTQAVMARRALDPATAGDLAALDPEAIARVREQAWPDAESEDELHDALVLLGYLTEPEAERWALMLDALAGARRAAVLTTHPKTPSPSMGEGEGGGETSPDEPHFGVASTTPAGHRVWIAAERLPQWRALFPDAALAPAIEAPARERALAWERDEALREIVRGRLEGLGPVTAESLASSMGLASTQVEGALVALEAEGFVLRGRFAGPAGDASAIEWCERRLLARIHRLTLDRLRREIEPVTAAQFLRFLIAWQHAGPETRLQGAAGLAQIVHRLQGYQAPAAAWEGQLLPARMGRYAPALLDELCLSGQVVWGRLFPPANGEYRRAPRQAGVPATRSSPIALLFRHELPQWLAAVPHGAGVPSKSSHPGAHPKSPSPSTGEGWGGGETQAGPSLSALAQQVVAHLQRHGASFAQELASATRRLPAEVRGALGELVAAGIITGDGFAGLRGLVANGRRTSARDRRQRWIGPFQPAISPEAVGRWSLLRNGAPHQSSPEELAELWARQLLRRYGVVFHKLMLRETGLPPWRDILRVLRRLEARGEVRGGRFVAGPSGEQYALPEAVEALRAMRRREPTGALAGVCGADPLNLVGIIAPGERVPAVASNRIVYRDGVPVAARIAGAVTYYQDVPDAERDAVLKALRG